MGLGSNVAVENAEMDFKEAVRSEQNKLAARLVAHGVSRSSAIRSAREAYEEAQDSEDNNGYYPDPEEICFERHGLEGTNKKISQFQISAIKSELDEEFD